MLDQLPYEVFLKICYDIDPDTSDKIYPDYVFRGPSAHLRSFSQVSHKLREWVLPIMIKQVSLLREYETEAVLEPAILQKFNAKLNLIKRSESYVEQLEVPSLSIDLIKVSDFPNLKSLTILGPISKSNRADAILSELCFLEHLAIDFDSTTMIKLPTHLQRLDILLASEQALEYLEIQKKSEVMELNITSKGFATILYSSWFCEMLLNFPKLKNLSIKNRGTSIFKDIWSSAWYETSITPLFDIIIKLRLENLTIEMFYLRHYLNQLRLVKNGFRVRTGREPPNLNITIIEKSLAGPFTNDDELGVLYLSSILGSSYNIKSLKLVYGLQTEIQPLTSVYVLKELLDKIFDNSMTSREFRNLRTIDSIYTLMAWNIREDTQLMNIQETDPFTLLSFEKDYRFLPDYKRLTKYKVTSNVPNKPCGISEDYNQTQIDYGFWSHEVILNDLLKMTEKPRRSNIWD